MPRYTTRPRGFWVEDEVFCEPAPSNLPQVAEHVAVETGLLDRHGNSIWRNPEPIGFKI